MTAIPIPPEPTSFMSPVVDYEPTPVGVTACPPPSPAALHRRTPRPIRSVAAHPVREPQPSHEAIVFADAALRRVLEVVDRRRPIAQLRPLVAPALIDTIIALARAPHTGAATLRRVRLRMVNDEAAEVFATYTRGQRLRAVAARVDRIGERWRIVALQIG
ncbi:Rv3235 family protein [Mycobacterium sp.]|uniref:Rv3235 family protein n=1 Tax=Mycobacterium sp. TaxID=1785 RepID=UPI002C5F376F|nr:Rv3235 family protein [Mycobacterium sp.]HKP43552.1 Rv3235 family protein [Mycobacterium sp.]